MTKKLDEARRGGYDGGAMSIATKTGDGGTTGLMYNRRVPKTHPRIEACGCVDELNAALGLARAQNQAPFVTETLLLVQRDLVVLMGELATPTEDLARYAKDGYPLMESSMIDKLDRCVAEIEAQNVPFQGWATPGANLAAASLDVARAVCRRAERRVCGLLETGEMRDGVSRVYLNRLSDVLWLMARWAERP
jgi:cob(I)alamin adenosyltransferase